MHHPTHTPAAGEAFRRPALAAAGLLLGLGLAAAVAAALREQLALPLRAPDLSLIAGEQLAVQAHLAAAVTALVVGVVIMVRPKGRGGHKTLGWTWVAAMAVTAASSFLIRRLNGGDFSWIHALSGWTLIALPMAVAAARRRKIPVHRRHMTGLLLGGLLLPGLFAFMPGRLLWRVFFG
jgi:uncharacterized membrane protein